MTGSDAGGSAISAAAGASTAAAMVGASVAAASIDAAAGASTAATLASPATAPETSGGGIPRRLRRRQRYVVEIDGEEFVVDTPDQALELLNKAKQEAKELAEKAVKRAAAATKRPTRKVIADARRALSTPEIKAPPELMDVAASVMESIQATYKEALQAVEIAAWMAKRDADIERDDEDILLLL